MSIVIWPACRGDNVTDFVNDDRVSVRLGPWRLEPAIRAAVHIVEGRRVLLTKALFNYAYVLASNPNRPMTWEAMFVSATGKRYGEFNTNVRASIKHLRARLGLRPNDLIHSRHDFGYEYVP